MHDRVKNSPPLTHSAEAKSNRVASKPDQLCMMSDFFRLFLFLQLNFFFKTNILEVRMPGLIWFQTVCVY